MILLSRVLDGIIGIILVGDMEGLGPVLVIEDGEIVGLKIKM